MNRSTRALALAALATVPASATWAAPHASPHGTRPSAKSKKVTPTPTPKPKTTVKTKKYTGPLVDMRWGPVQAIIYLKGKKITKVSIVTNPENFRSQFIDDQAVPYLQQETLQAQNANIDLISGATMTSEAYIVSLEGAFKKAHLPVN